MEPARDSPTVTDACCVLVLCALGFFAVAVPAWFLFWGVIVPGLVSGGPWVSWVAAFLNPVTLGSIGALVPIVLYCETRAKTGDAAPRPEDS